MFPILVFLFVIAIVKSELRICNKPKTYMVKYLEVKCSDSIYGEKLLSEDLNFGESVTKVTLENVTFNTLPENVFSEAKSIGNLEVIIMKNCGIDIIENGAFKNLTEVTLLNFGNNIITYLKVGLFNDTINLQKLYFAGNKIEVLENGLFDKLQFLKDVSFIHNHIKEIGENIFTYNMNLQFIYLSNNNITYMSYKTMKHLKNIRIGLHENPWICDCNLINFIHFVINNRISIIPNCNNINNPKNIRQFSWKNITTNDLSCKPTVDLTLHQITPELYDLLCTISPNDITISNISLEHMTTSEALSTIYKIANLPSTLKENVTCSASNQFGSITKSVNITKMAYIYAGTKEEPITKTPIDKKVELECTRFTFKKVSVKWFFKNGAIQQQTDKYEQKHSESNEGGTLSSLLIKDVAPIDQGLYKCTNDNGQEEQYFQLLFDSNKEKNNLRINLLLTIVLCIVLIFILLIVTVCTVVYIKFCRKKSKKVEPTKRFENQYVFSNNDRMIESNVYCSYNEHIYEEIK